MVVLPIIAGANAMIRLSLKSTLKEGQKANSVGSVFAAFDVMQNAASVTVQLYLVRLVMTRVLRHGFNLHACIAGYCLLLL